MGRKVLQGVKDRVKDLISVGVYDQHKIFRILYPTFNGHYSHLRDIISEVKNR